MAAMHGVVLDNFLAQTRVSPGIGSPFIGNLCRLLSERLDDSTAFGRRILGWDGNPHQDALALRACGALQSLVQSGAAPALTAAYPPTAFDADALWAAIVGALAGHDARLTAFLDSPPQTNEVARSSMILGAALIVATRFGLPIETLEMGASGGLNLGFDGYRYDFGNGLAWGDPAAELEIPSEWRGSPPPLDAPLRVVGRAGCDRNPLDPADPADADRLRAYVWADQPQRRARIGIALRLAAAAGRRPVSADAADWAEEQLATPQPEGRCRLFYHTIVLQYLPEDGRKRVLAALARAGAAATDSRPLAHFSFETDYNPDGARLGAPMALTLWPTGETLDLGRADYHGRWVEWR